MDINPIMLQKRRVSFSINEINQIHQFVNIGKNPTNDPKIDETISMLNTEMIKRRLSDTHGGSPGKNTILSIVEEDNEIESYMPSRNESLRNSLKDDKPSKDFDVIYNAEFNEKNQN